MAREETDSLGLCSVLRGLDVRLPRSALHYPTHYLDRLSSVERPHVSPAPLALVSASTGGVQKPKAGVLGSTDSATGAPENHKGEAVEAEASNFVNSIASVALSSASGKHPQDEPATAETAGAPNDSVPDPTALAMGASGARAKQNGADLKHDKSKVPMETAMWNGMRPIMHAIGDLNDTWERFANALSPTPPFLATYTACDLLQSLSLCWLPQSSSQATWWSKA